MSEAKPTKPGDEATPGAPGTGENLCRHCHGTGRVESAPCPEPCPECRGTGVITSGIGGG